MMPLRLLLILPLLVAADWPQFLGANRDGATAEVLAALPEKPAVLWRVALGPSHSSPVVAAGKVYAFYQPKGEQADELAAFDARTGKVIWQKRYARGPFATPFGTGPRSTPTVSGDAVVTFGPTGVLTGWDASTGAIRWQVEALKKYAAPNLLFGVSASPLIADGKVVVPIGGQGAGLVAFDLKTGQEVWRTQDDPASYASPIVTGSGENRQVIALTGSHLRAVELATGKPVWAVPFKDDLNESSTTPVVTKDLLLASSVTRGTIALNPNGDATPKARWTGPKLTCYFSTPIVMGEQIYMVIGEATLFNATVSLKCVEAATGKVLWTEPKLGKYHAALMKTSDQQLLMLDDTGRLTLLKPDPMMYRVVNQVKICGETWAHPALADGILYVRDNKELIALQLKP